MAVGIALDDTHDIFLEGSSFRRTNNGAYVAQKVLSTLQTVLGESVLEPDLGLPYYTEVFVRPVDVPAVSTLIKEAILNVDGVNRLLTFDIDFDSASRQFKVNFSVNTTYGDIDPIDVTINPGG